MSWGTCYSGSNNIHFNIPPSMNDGRLFSNYEAACHANNQLKESLGITNNYQYRQWLIHNGNKVASKNNQLASSQCVMKHHNIKNKNIYIKLRTFYYGYKIVILKYVCI